jgi:hypothetical protein
MNDRLNRQVAAELRKLESASVLTPREAQRIAERYPTSAWDVASLVRVFTVLGALCAAAGAIVLAAEHLNAMRVLEVSLAAAAVFLIAGARWVRSKDMDKTAAAMEMLGGFAVQGFTTVLAFDLSTGSDNWPALIGLQTILIASLAYALRNRLMLAHATVLCFVWFGGSTGYVSGWGMYWLGMSYPMRFAGAGVAALGGAWLHARFGGPFQHFSRVYAHFGSFVLHVALWIMSLFGSFRDYHVNWNNPGERLAYTAVWAAVSCAYILAGARFGIGLLRSYGVVFLIINIYTFYFQFVAGHWAELWFIHLLIVGGSMIAVGFRLERWLHRRTPAPKTDEPASV